MLARPQYSNHSGPLIWAPPQKDPDVEYSCLTYFHPLNGVIVTYPNKLEHPRFHQEYKRFLPKTNNLDYHPLKQHKKLV